MPVAITVAIPTHNRPEMVTMAVQSALAQSRPPEQVLVIADGCTDGTRDALRGLAEPSLDLLDLPKGPGYGYGHRNTALARAKGEVVAWLGDDDLYLPDHLERLTELFEGGHFDLVQTGACRVREDGTLEGMCMDWRVPYYRELFLSGHNATPAGAVAHRVSSALEVGGWRAELPHAADMDLWQRLLRAGARTAMSLAPTLLHFRAASREQPYDERVAQNADFLARLSDPAALAPLRAKMAEAIQARWAEDARRARELDAELHSTWSRLQTEVEALQPYPAEVERLRNTLEGIYASRWWRLGRALKRAASRASRASAR